MYSRNKLPTGSCYLHQWFWSSIHLGINIDKLTHLGLITQTLTMYSQNFILKLV